MLKLTTLFVGDSPTSPQMLRMLRFPGLGAEVKPSRLAGTFHIGHVFFQFLSGSNVQHALLKTMEPTSGPNAQQIMKRASKIGLDRTRQDQ